MDLDDWAELIGNNNFKNGWHDRFHELEQAGDTEGARDHVIAKVMLVTTELAEAVEELRSGRALAETYEGEGGKPEGFGVEIADSIIRLLDLADMLGLPIGRLVNQKVAFNATRGRMHGGKTV